MEEHSKQAVSQIWGCGHITGDERQDQPFYTEMTCPYCVNPNPRKKPPIDATPEQVANAKLRAYRSGR